MLLSGIKMAKVLTATKFLLMLQNLIFSFRSGISGFGKSKKNIL